MFWWFIPRIITWYIPVSECCLDCLAINSILRIPFYLKQEPVPLFLESLIFSLLLNQSSPTHESTLLTLQSWNILAAVYHDSTDSLCSATSGHTHFCSWSECFGLPRSLRLSASIKSLIKCRCQFPQLINWWKFSYKIGTSTLKAYHLTFLI